MSDENEQKPPSKGKSLSPWQKRPSGSAPAPAASSIPYWSLAMSNLTKLAIAAVLIVVVMIAGGSFYTVDQGERGVVLRYGAVNHVAKAGLGFKLPFIDRVEKISVQTQTFTWQQVNSYSSDQQPADLKISVTFHVDPERVEDLYARFGSVNNAVNRVISPIVNRDIKVVFGQFTAARAIQERGRLNTDAREAVRVALDSEPLVLQSLQIENIDFSKEYIRSVEQRMEAEVEVQRLRQNAEREKVQAQITVTKANAEADSTLARAKANAEATRLRGEAEALAIRAKGDALRDNPGLVNLVQAERWNGVLPSTMVPGSALPMLNVQTVPSSAAK